jgi:hypothetical protein
MKQPALGIASTALMVAISLGFIHLFSFATFTGWVAYYLLCLIPIQIVTVVLWKGALPEFAGKARQPLKGILLILTAMVVGAAIAHLYWDLAGAGPGADWSATLDALRAGPPSPMLAMCTIVSVIITFWACIMWGGWPFTALIRNHMATGFVTLIAAYIVNYFLFRFFFDYGFMQGAPVYVAALDPHGLVPAWNATAFYLTLLAGMFFIVNFDLWPLTSAPSVMKQPALAIVWTAACFLLAAIAYNIGVRGLGMDPVAYMVRVPVPFVFGTIVVQNMMQGSLFASLKQPVKGLANVATVILVGQALAAFYRAAAPLVTGVLQSGPPGYDMEIWTASALLSVTFPFLIFHAAYFDFWPLAQSK